MHAAGKRAGKHMCVCLLLLSSLLQVVCHWLPAPQQCATGVCSRQARRIRCACACVWCSSVMGLLLSPCVRLLGWGGVACTHACMHAVAPDAMYALHVQDAWCVCVFLARGVGYKWAAVE